MRLFDAFQEEEFCYFLMELCRGGDLGMLLDATSKQTEEHARFYGGCVVLALRHLHSYGWIHRDLKPDNVLVSEDMQSKVADFGESRFFDEKRTSEDGAMTMTMVGTMLYCPPEASVTL